MSPRASIDLGTHTCLLLVADCDPQGVVQRVIEERVVFTRLGEGVDRARSLSPAAMERALECLRSYSNVVTRHGVSPAEVACVATSQARDAANGADFFTRVSQETGFVFRVISGDEEARLSFLGTLLPGVDPARAAVLDIGGGSTELVTQDGGTFRGASLDVGSVRFTERYLKGDPPSREELAACQAAIDSEISKALADERWRFDPRSHCLLAAAGTATTLAAWKLELKRFDSAQVDRCVLSEAELRGMVETLGKLTIEGRRALPGMEPARAPVILAGAMILWRVLALCGFPEARVSSRGLRYGVLLS